MLRHGYLAGMEDVDAEVGGPLEGGQAAGVFAQAPQHNGRIERYRAERIGGKAFELAVGPARGNDADTGGELAKRIAQIAQVGLRNRGVAYPGGAEACDARCWNHLALRS